MNRDLLIPRRKPARQFWLMRIVRHVAGCVSSLIQRIGNYRYYRKQGICHSIAWAQSGSTL